MICDAQLSGDSTPALQVCWTCFYVHYDLFWYRTFQLTDSLQLVRHFLFWNQFDLELFSDKKAEGSYLW